MNQYVIEIPEARIGDIAQITLVTRDGERRLTVVPHAPKLLIPYFGRGFILDHKIRWPAYELPEL